MKEKNSNLGTCGRYKSLGESHRGLSRVWGRAEAKNHAAGGVATATGEEEGDVAGDTTQVSF